MKHTLASLLLAAIDYPEDIAQHLQKAILHSDTGMDIIPANRRLADAAARLQIMQLSQYQPYGDNSRSCEAMLKHITDALCDTYHYIIIDCGLKHELLTVNALTAADYCIIPVQAHYLASEGIPDVLELVRTVQAHFNPSLKIAGILLTMYQSRPQLCQSVRTTVGEVYGEAFHVRVKSNIGGEKGTQLVYRKLADRRSCHGKRVDKAFIGPVADLHFRDLLGSAHALLQQIFHVVALSQATTPPAPDCGRTPRQGSSARSPGYSYRRQGIPLP